MNKKRIDNLYRKVKKGHGTPIEKIGLFCEIFADYIQYTLFTGSWIFCEKQIVGKKLEKTGKFLLYNEAPKLKKGLEYGHFVKDKYLYLKHDEENFIEIGAKVDNDHKNHDAHTANNYFERAKDIAKEMETSPNKSISNISRDAFGDLLSRFISGSFRMKMTQKDECPNIIMKQKDKETEIERFAYLVGCHEWRETI